jgi:F-type H+-transporting ATPase subunit b
MPQFEFSTFLPQMVWLAIFFAVLYFGVVRLTLPKVGRVIEAREDQVSGDLSAAQGAKAESDRMAADYDAGVATAQDAARAKVTEARSAATVAIEAKLKQSSEAIAQKSAKAQADLDAARSSALAQVESVAADAAADIVERLTGKRPADTVAATAARSVLG